MTRSQKLSKLANAIRAYRGLYHANNKEWIHRPQSKAAARVNTWLERCGYNVAESRAKIDGFTDLTQFRNWLNLLK